MPLFSRSILLDVGIPEARRKLLVWSQSNNQYVQLDPSSPRACSLLTFTQPHKELIYDEAYILFYATTKIKGKDVIIDLKFYI